MKFIDRSSPNNWLYIVLVVGTAVVVGGALILRVEQESFPRPEPLVLQKFIPGQEIVVRGTAAENGTACSAAEECSLAMVHEGRELSLAYRSSESRDPCRSPRVLEEILLLKQGDSIKVSGRYEKVEGVRTIFLCDSPFSYVEKVKSGDEFAGWTPVKSGDFGVEFLRPKGWRHFEAAQENAIVLVGPLRVFIMNVARDPLLSSAGAGEYRVSYCEENLQDVSRCEVLERGELSVFVDWGRGQGEWREAMGVFATEGEYEVAVFLFTSAEFTPEVKDFFRTFLSTVKTI